MPVRARFAGFVAGLTASLLLLVGCEQPPKQPAPSPALWEVTGARGERAFLFGTVHSLPPGIEWKTPQVAQAFAASDVLVVEVDLDSNGRDIAGIFERLAHTSGLPPLSHRLPPSDRAALIKAMKGKGFSDVDFTGMESWAAAITLSQAYDDNDGGEGVDLALIKEAGRKPVIELEGAERQLRLFDALPEADQRDLLASVAREALAGEALGQGRLAGWLKGDIAALEQETREGLLADPELREALLVGRNRDWANRIAAGLRPGRTMFIAVGAAHMVGPDGLAALLSGRGYTVKRLR